MDRSENMRRIRSKDTLIELQIRRLIFSMGYRYRIHGVKLPGKPDVIFTKRKKAIFIHGCFWHLHENCAIARYPKTNIEYWWPKLEKNKKRDAENLSRLREMGWKCLVLWECQLNNLKKIQVQIRKFLEK